MELQTGIVFVAQSRDKESRKECLQADRKREGGQIGVYWELSHMCVSDRTHCALITRDKVDKL